MVQMNLVGLGFHLVEYRAKPNKIGYTLLPHQQIVSGQCPQYVAQIVHGASLRINSYKAQFSHLQHEEDLLGLARNEHVQNWPCKSFCKDISYS